MWVDSGIGVPIGARVKVTPSGQRLLVDDDGKVNTIFCLAIEQNEEFNLLFPSSIQKTFSVLKTSLKNSVVLFLASIVLFPSLASSRSRVCPRSRKPLSRSCTLRQWRGWMT